jgi:hypothetical protein
METAILQMRKQAEEKQYGIALKSCADACGQFVKMHEDNGLSYATDQLYHLRKTAKSLSGKVDSVSIDSMAILIKSILDLRNKITTAACPYPIDKEKCTCYSARIDKLSKQIDAIALAITVRNAKDIKGTILELPSILNEAYGAALNCTGDEDKRIIDSESGPQG